MRVKWNWLRRQIKPNNNGKLATQNQKTNMRREKHLWRYLKWKTKKLHEMISTRQQRKKPEDGNISTGIVKVDEICPFRWNGICTNQNENKTSKILQEVEMLMVPHIQARKPDLTFICHVVDFAFPTPVKHTVNWISEEDSRPQHWFGFDT